MTPRTAAFGVFFVNGAAIGTWIGHIPWIQDRFDYSKSTLGLVLLAMSAGAFIYIAGADLIPELQGRFPIRVELDSLTEEDFVRILTEPENALLKQYRALLSAETVDLKFTDEAVREIARDAERVNRALENIGARRLHTIMERLLEDISFAGPENAGREISIGVDDVRAALADLVRDEDLSRYVL